MKMNLRKNTDTGMEKHRGTKPVETGREMLPTAAYIMVSEKEEESPEYDSQNRIRTRISNAESGLLPVQSYIAAQEDLVLADTYMEYDSERNDTSESGGNRPEFVRLMEDVRCGKIRCIVVSSLSHFGRDYLEAGYYLETIFPLLNVRFISMNDHFDSSRESDRNSLKLRIQSLVKGMYAEEFSKKQEAFVELCQKTGRVTGQNNAYGYRFLKETGRLVIDKKTEPYVRMIFAWTLSGVGKNEIAHRMELLGAPTPGEGANIYKKADWSGHLLQGILYNPVYAGFHVMGKRKVSLYRGISQHGVDRGQWLYFPDYHEPYITMEEYEEIQGMLTKNRVDRTRALKVSEDERAKLPDYFQGKVVCADCNRKMMFLRGTHGKTGDREAFGYYRCRSRKSEGVCTNGHVQGNLVQIVVTDRIRELEAYRDLKEITPELAGELVEKIMVYENGKRMDVRFKGQESYH